MLNLTNDPTPAVLKKYAYIFLLLLFILPVRMNAQSINRYNTFSYNVNEGLLQSTMGQLAIDKNNFCWISFPNGIQQFDGNNFRTVKVQPGLPDDKYVKFFSCNNGDLLISHSQGISKYEIGKNSFTLVYKQNPALQKPAFFIGEDEGIIYFYDEAATISGMECGSFKITSSVKTGFPVYSFESINAPRFSDNILDHKIAFWMKKNICIWDLPNKKLLYQSPPLPNTSPFLLRLLPQGKILYYNYIDNDALQCWDITTGTSQKLMIAGKDKEKYLSRFITHHWQDKYIVAINNRIYETDSTFLVLRSELVNFQNLPVTTNFGIAGMVEDNFGNLYVQTINGGIKKIIRNNYPVRYYGSLNKEENIIIGVLPDKKNNRILVGTSEAGLFIFDTLQRLTRHFTKLPNNKSNFSVNAITKDDHGDYLLFVSGEKKIWKLSADLSTFTSYPVSFYDTTPRGIDYFGSTIYRGDKEAVVQSMYQVFRTDFESNKTTAKLVTGEYTLGRLWFDNKIISHENDALIFLDGQTFKQIKKIPFPNTGGVRCFAKDAENILLGTNKGIFKIDINGKILYQWNKENGLPDDCIYAIAFDKDGNMWCSSNKGVARIDKNNNMLQLTKEDGLQENEFNTGIVATAEDGELFFGGMNGVSSFFPSVINSFDEKIKMLVTRIRVNNNDIQTDSALWNIDKLKLHYNQNSLSFDFVAMANNNPAQYIYQYRMLGIDKEWTQNSGMQTVRYSLPPGKYTFQLYASRSFDKDAKPMKEMRIIIQPPFWKAWWFLTALAAALILLLTYAINQRNKRKYAKKLQQLENEREIKAERERISKDLHDSLGAYANAVLYNTDQLEKERTEQKRSELMSDLKFASKGIITSLRETVWALKKESYTAEECILRIRNFIQPFTRYYEHIHFKVTGEAPAGMILHYTKALNMVRIVQEAVSNSIKHAGASEITISSFPEENTWKLVIADDGKGFDQVIDKETEEGNGLSHMKHRAADSGFKFDITTGNSGTIITIIV